MGNAYPDGAVDEVIFWMEGQGRMGRKAKAGFFAYDEAGKRQGYWDGLADQYPRAANNLTCGRAASSDVRPSA